MPATIDTARATQVPLVVDMDGTLIRTDMMWESLANLLRQNPAAALTSLFWLFRGRARFKKRLAVHTRVNAAILPYHPEFLDWLRGEKRTGRKIILATASDLEMARPVAKHVGVFDEVLASDGITNLRGKAKLASLQQRFGNRGFDYAGNSAPDLDVWRGSRKAIVVNASDRLVRQAAECAERGPIFPQHGSLLRGLIQTLRPSHWLKNLLVFVPIIAAGKTTFWPMLCGAGAWVALCFCDSGLFGLGDVVNLEKDRRSPTGVTRPMATGELPLSLGLPLFTVILGLGLVIAWQVTPELVALLAVYLTCASVCASGLKHAAWLDVLVRAGLYMLRLVAGNVVTGINFSVWLVTCSLFGFLGLGVMERCIARRIGVQASASPPDRLKSEPQRNT